MDLAGGVQGFELAFVDGEVLIAEVAEVDGAGAVVGELVGAGSTNTQWRIRACFLAPSAKHIP